MDEERRYPAEPLAEFAAAALRRVGLPDEDAALVADTLLKSDLRGHSSHGIFRLPWYVRRLRSGVMRPLTALEVVRERGGVTVLDAHDGVGQVVAQRAMRLAVERAAEHGVATVAVRRSNHFGAAMYFTLEAAAAGCVGILITNASPAMAPWGGSRALIGNNPWSIAAPAGHYPPLLLDFANTVVARGKIYTARQAGNAIPPGWAIDRDGQPTTDPVAALEGLILPIGGHKGYAQSFMFDVLAGVLTGARFASGVFGPYQAERPSGCGHLALALDIDHFMDLPEFEARVEELIVEIKSAPLAPGQVEIFYPGEPEARAEERNSRLGIPLPANTVADLDALAGELALASPF
ncbi:MAG TPA: Ldh family oxidoreductase [Thermomicrobiaceae bacterium]|nr:Ldh family oxidoreductase [Thermomicrobiaceae bacterium]